jgi:hypothetical protein
MTSQATPYDERAEILITSILINRQVRDLG